MTENSQTAERPTAQHATPESTRQRPRPRNSRGRILILVQNLPVPFDRRVWLECQSLIDAGFRGRGGVSQRPRATRPMPGSTESSSSSTGPMRPADRAPLSSLNTSTPFLPPLTLSLKASLRGRFTAVQSCNPPDLFWPIGLLFRLLHGSSFVFDHHDLCPELYQSRFPDGNQLVYRALRFMERCTMTTADHVISTNDSYREIAPRAGRSRPGGCDRRPHRTRSDPAPSHRSRTRASGAPRPTWPPTWG